MHMSVYMHAYMCIYIFIYIQYQIKKDLLKHKSIQTYIPVADPLLIGSTFTIVYSQKNVSGKGK